MNPTQRDAVFLPFDVSPRCSEQCLFLLLLFFCSFMCGHRSTSEMVTGPGSCGVRYSSLISVILFLFFTHTALCVQDPFRGQSQSSFLPAPFRSRPCFSVDRPGRPFSAIVGFSLLGFATSSLLDCSPVSCPLKENWK